MQLPWVRLDTTFPGHDKVLDLVERGLTGKAAIGVYCCSLAHCGAQGTDGLITFASLPFVHGTKALAALLVEVGLWEPDPRGWRVRNWDERQQTNETTQRIRTAQSAGAKRANCVRWHGKDCGCWQRSA